MPWEAIKTILGLRSARSCTLQQCLERGRDDAPVAVTTAAPSATSQIAFTIAVIALAAKMSKADGVTSCAEAKVFEEQFRVPDSERANVRRVFELASQDVAGFESYARQAARLLQNEPEMRIAVLECLFHVATADGVLHPNEEDYLHTVALILGIGDKDFTCVRRGFISEPDNPFDVLNVDPKASDADIKTRYRELVRSHHPDLLISKGVPAEYLAAAERRLAAITVAYEQIRTERGHRPTLEFETVP